ncbi:MAG: hypothetical protein NTV52_01745 [Acidobacteria bacterium]|nr:hypothetical protein [Acidobacteriota bacterium]
MKFTVDSNYLICVLQSWNTHHGPTIADLERRLDEGQKFHLVPHTLLESYSVMTRMPDPFRKPPSTVLGLLRQNFGEFPLLPLPVNPWHLLDDLAERGLGGGQTYDRSIAFAAHQGGINELVTWNLKHFQPHAFPGVVIVRPRER